MFLFVFGGRATKNHHQVSVDTSSSAAASQQVCSPSLSASRLRSLAPAAARRPRRWVRSVGRILITDWWTHKYVLFALLLLCITTAVVAAFYLNLPQPHIAPDSSDYLGVVHYIQTQGQLVNDNRLPGYPLLIVLVYALFGQNNLLAVSVAQAILFVLATLELYVLAVLVLRRGWLAFLIGLLVGTNLTLLSNVKPILSEALALWLLVSLALAVALFVYTLRTGVLWLVATLTLALFLTRAEWIYLPVPLFTYLLLVAARQGVARRLLPHVLLALLLLYAVLGDYIYINAQVNNFPGVVVAQNTNAFGKVLQYNMQDEAPPQYATVSKIVDTYVARHIKIDILAREPSLAHNHYALADEYAWAIIEHHPGEFLAKSVPWVFSSLADFEPARVDARGAFGRPLLVLQSLFLFLNGWNTCFPLCAAFWLLLLGRRRTAQLRSIQTMGAVVFLTLYGLILTTLGGIGEYQRLHTPFNPLLILVVWATLLSGLLLAIRQGPRVLTFLASRYFRLSEQQK